MSVPMKIAIVFDNLGNDLCGMVTLVYKLAEEGAAAFLIPTYN